MNVFKVVSSLTEGQHTSLVTLYHQLPSRRKQTHYSYIASTRQVPDLDSRTHNVWSLHHIHPQMIITWEYVKFPLIAQNIFLVRVVQNAKKESFTSGMQLKRAALRLNTIL